MRYTCLYVLYIHTQLPPSSISFFKRSSRTRRQPPSLGRGALDMVFTIEQNDRLALAARILQKLSGTSYIHALSVLYRPSSHRHFLSIEIYPTRSEPVLRNQAANMELYAFREATDRSSYLQNVASTIKREQANANAALYNPTGNTSSSTTHPPSNAAARRGRPQSTSAATTRPRGRPGRPRSTSNISASAGPAAGATNNNNNPNFASMSNGNSNGIMSAEMIINLQRQHQRNAQQQQQQQRALALQQQQQRALAMQQAQIRKHAIANGLNQAQVQALMASNPMFNRNPNVQIPVRTNTAAPSTSARTQQAHPANRTNKAHPHQQQNRQPQNPQFPIVRQKLVSFFKTYKDDFNIIVAQLPAFVQATDPSKRDLVKKRLRAAHTLFEAIRSNRVPLSVTEELVDGHSNFMGMVISWFKRTHPHIFMNANNANNAANPNNVNIPQRQHPAQSNANSVARNPVNRPAVPNAQNIAAVQHARATAAAHVAAQSQAKAAEKARLLFAQQRAAKAQLEARRALEAQQAKQAAQQAKQAVQQAAATVAVPPQATKQTAPAVRNNVAPVNLVKSNAHAVVQVMQRQSPANAQKKLPVGNRNGSPAGIGKARPPNTKINPNSSRQPARGPPKLTKEQYKANLDKRLNSILYVCSKLEKNAKEQAIAVEKAAEEIRKKRARYSILSLQKFMKETREATYGKDEMKSNSVVGDKLVQCEKKKTFVCTGEGGLFISEMKNGKATKDTPELNHLREVVIADCRAAREKNAGMEIDMTEDFGLPVVACQLLIPEMKMPKLIIRVQRGYPTVSAVTYRLVTPALGWTGTLERIRSEFRRRIHKQSPVESGLGVASMLDAWATVAEEVVDKEIRVDAGVESGDVGIMA